MKHFNPRPRKEGDDLPPDDTGHINDFNPRPRKEGDTFTFREDSSVDNFNPRPRKEGDFSVKGLSISLFLFQSTPS